ARQREQLLRTEHAAAVEAERTSLAREMHDVLSARFSSMALLSAAALNRVPAPSQDPAWQAIRRPVGEIRREALAGLEEMTRMVRMLHAGAPQALRATLDSANALIEAHRAGGRTIHYTGEVDPSQVGAAAQTAAYRTISELLVNHSRHAPHTALRL
ncbi:sensor histidine kinase, partial [Glutamicibacter creatinolyticus]|uniref:sensor histidine kinase n=1 Tax=Glutamicibacter creatinolyticus TaxID=162496 RepID=UPI003B984055